MPKEFRLPDLGEGVTEGQIVRLLIAEGDQVREDQPLFEVETDKASVEIPSPHTGVVTRLHVAEQQVVNVGDVMVTFDGGPADTTAPPLPSGTPGTTRRGEEPAGVEPQARGRAPAPPAAGRSTAQARTKPASPAIRKLARTLGVDLQNVDGSGPGGRVIREDVERATTKPPPPSRSPEATRRGEGRAGVGVEAPAQPETPALVDPDPWGPTRREPLTRARRAIGEAMSLSKSTIPHATDTDDADVTDLDRLRRGEGAGTLDRKLTILPFVVRAAVQALREHPIFNASYDRRTGEIVYHDYIGIAIGVHTDRGLIAPVLRDADRLSLTQIADELAVLAEKARTASFEVNDTRGGTFTISNAGAVGGSRYSTPIINPPQSAVLALGRTRPQPWVVDGQVVPRLIMPLSLSFDHRLIDGAQEVHFMRRIITALENPGEELTK